MMRSTAIGALGLAACLAIGLSGASAADDMVAARQLSGSKIGFLVKDPYGFATLTVSGPNEFNADAFSRSGAVAIDLRRYGDLEDGAYSYQLTAASNTKVKRRLGLDDGRGDRTSVEQPVSAAINGTFYVKGGAIVEPSDTPPAKNDRDAK
jgi:hypothetical protein